MKTTLVQLLQPVVKVVRRPKKDETKEMAEIENKIAIEHICKILFHGTVAVYSYMVFRGRPWVPWYLGGEDDNKAFCLDYPFTLQDRQLYYFMLLTLGQPTQMLFEALFMNERTPDFYELLLHHIVTVVLIFTAVAGNFSN